MLTKDALIMQRVDNVATVLQDVAAGDVVAARLGENRVTVTAQDAIPFGFKVALTDIPRGATIYKYGEVIGTARTPIAAGALVHVHNLEGTRGRGDRAERRAAP